MDTASLVKIIGNIDAFIELLDMWASTHEGHDYEAEFVEWVMDYFNGDGFVA